MVGAVERQDNTIVVKYCPWASVVELNVTEEQCGLIKWITLLQLDLELGDLGPETWTSSDEQEVVVGNLGDLGCE